MSKKFFGKISIKSHKIKSKPIYQNLAFKFSLRNMILIYNALQGFNKHKSSFHKKNFFRYTLPNFLQKGQKAMKNFLANSKGKFLFCFFVLFNGLLFAANPLTEFKSKVDSELNETMKTIMGMANTVVGTIGIVWLIICFIFAKGQPERFKENMKGIIVISVIIGIAYGITYAYK